MNKGILAAAGMGAMIIAAPAVAGTNTQDSNSVVTYEDLDLSTSEGRKELDQRITIAARKNCGVGRHTTGSRTISREQRRCVASAERQAKNALAPIIEEQQLGG
ncbi:UrcA family protein [Altererythrobacter sp.]|uniref:UrcA family protein n=1 Tax=Altererythrobacter sp. TaxID=1872480 RepID=UPI001B238FCC|nr:UrcA family protein [Altererythrobacter sp.]MBO6609421.1 UrcA family protein [Altererythrobacter sp.]MBO6642288.1 UrcA family protein [Altererythrobacter sp.]MBO6709204.1 UrcA family protein [Altererythrobacter sp.]MBO6944688.1 UrcA family protein [Altererythrobacter sp.]